MFDSLKVVSDWGDGNVTVISTWIGLGGRGKTGMQPEVCFLIFDSLLLL